MTNRNQAEPRHQLIARLNREWWFCDCLARCYRQAGEAVPPAVVEMLSEVWFDMCSAGLTSKEIEAVKSRWGN